MLDPDGIGIQKSKYGLLWRGRFYYMRKYSLLVPTLVALTLIIGGCGGGSGSTAASLTTKLASTVQGVAAAGSPISGTVDLYDLSDPVKKISAKTTDAGEFSIDTTGLTPPFILKTIDGSNNNLFSYASGPGTGTVNINPLTTVAVVVAAGVNDSNALAALYNNYDPKDPQSGSSAITQMQQKKIFPVISNVAKNIATSLNLLLDTYCQLNDPTTGKTTATFTNDFMTGLYVANHLGLDDLFDKVAFTISKDSNGMVAITRKDTNASVFPPPSPSPSYSNLSTGTLLTPTNIPAPTQYEMPGNAVLTLKVQGALPQGTLIKNATFSIKLPLGITVVTTPSLEVGPAVVNTTIPIGTAVGSNSAATLSATNGMLNITMSSVTGFNTGDFLTIRYTDSSIYYMHKRTPADFVISGSVLFSDIYKSQKLQNLTIVPSSIAFP
ncbi:MAG: hypothetical protein WC156_08090 [Pedobacter sp.]